MEDLHHVTAIFVGTFTSLWDFLVWMLKVSRDCGVEPSIPGMIAILIIVALWVGSGLTAATIAEARERKRFAHMAGGLLLPVVYPFAMLVFMPKAQYALSPEEKERQKALKKEEELAARGPSAAELSQQPANQVDPNAGTSGNPAEAPKPRISIARGVMPGERASASDTCSFAKPSAAQPHVGAQSQQAGATAFTQKYFANIATDENGNFRGPFMFETNDNRFVEAVRISNALPEVLVVEIQAEGGRTRSVRLPYSKILECKLKSEWMGHDPNSR